MNFSSYVNKDFEGAGIVYLTPSNEVLILQKPNKKWCFVGGKKESHETPFETAKRESKEEIGFIASGTLIDLIEHKKANGDAKVCSFIMKIDKSFVPHLNNEHIKYKWVKIKKLKEYIFSNGVHNLISILQNKYK
jgi:8-oxo-dGTP pyrophosphatase MutT (NUDIX family)